MLGAGGYMMTTPHTSFEAGWRAGAIAGALRVSGRRPALFSRVGIDRASRCLDLGCGGGDVSVALAALAPDGFVVGSDVDETKLELARSEAMSAGLRNVEYRVEDVMEPATDHEVFDIVYVRFLLTHLPDPAKALRNICSRLAPAGVLIVEDILHGQLLPPALARVLALRRAVHKGVQARGCDPTSARACLHC